MQRYVSRLINPDPSTVSCVARVMPPEPARNTAFVAREDACGSGATTKDTLLRAAAGGTSALSSSSSRVQRVTYDEGGN